MNCNYLVFKGWAQQGMILRPPDYESGATNQLSYGPEKYYYQKEQPGFEPATLPILSGCY